MGHSHSKKPSMYTSKPSTPAYSAAIVRLTCVSHAPHSKPKHTVCSVHTHQPFERSPLGMINTTTTSRQRPFHTAGEIYSIAVLLYCRGLVHQCVVHTVVLWYCKHAVGHNQHDDTPSSLNFEPCRFVPLTGLTATTYPPCRTWFGNFTTCLPLVLPGASGWTNTVVWGTEYLPLTLPSSVYTPRALSMALLLYIASSATPIDLYDVR